MIELTAEQDYLLDQFMDLFEGRRDAVFTDSRMQVKLPIKKWRESIEQAEGAPTHYDSFTIEVAFKEHLFGTEPIGVYPLRNGNECKWICSDFDDENAEEYAWRLASSWEHYGIQAWVETSRSKGYHVWVFADDWMSGTIARRAGLWVHAHANIPALELNPKTELTDGYGNCVRLPYPKKKPSTGSTFDDIALSTIERMAGIARNVVWIAGGKTPYALGEFVEQAHKFRTPVDELLKLAVRWEPPPLKHGKRAPKRDYEPGAERDNEHIRSVFAGDTMVKNGERDTVLHCLAMHMWGKGLDETEAREVMQEVWNEQVEDKSSFPLKDALRKVRAAYRG